MIKDLGETDFIGVIKKRITMKCYSDYKNGWSQHKKKKVHGEQWKILKWLVTVTLCRENWNLFGQIDFSLVGYFILLSQQQNESLE